MSVRKKNIVIVDYGLGNLRSLYNAFKYVGVNPIVTSDPEKINYSDGMVIPGVGAFGKAMEKINLNNLFDPMKTALDLNKPTLGICLGMQLLFEESEESPGISGFSYFAGKVKKIDVSNQKGARLPHIGWTTSNEYEQNDIFFAKSILKHLIQQKQYFVHSFAAVPTEKKDILLTAKYAEKEFVSAVQKNNVIGVQFHPEKSREPGLTILRNFVSLC